MNIKIFKCDFSSITNLLISGLILTLFVTIVGTDLAGDTNGNPKGKDIVRNEPSISSILTNREEFDKLSKMAEEATTESEQLIIWEKAEELTKGAKEWFEKYKNPEIDEKIKIKEDLLQAVISNEINTIGMEAFRGELPFTSIGYDYENYSLEVTIDPKKFTEKNIKRYFKKVRSIVGDEINITISPMEYPTRPTIRPSR